jgi:MFS family permease
MNWDVYLRLSALMFMEFAVWAAWMPVLAIRLLGPLKMTGKQTGWIYATFPLACIFAPFASGYLADRWFNAEWIILVSHAFGAVLLFIAARQNRFWGMFWVMLVYCVFFTATLPLLNKMLNLYFPADDPQRGWVQPWIFLWAPVAWALIGYLLTLYRQVRKLGGDGPDSIYMAAFLSVLMVVICALQPAAAPKPVGNPMLAALGMLTNVNYLVFILVQLFVAGMMQFYFLGTGRFMQDKGIQGRNVSAVMGIAQAVQAAATWLLLAWSLGTLGFQWTFVLGALCWTALYVVYVASRRPLWIILSQSFHGLAYVFFMIGGQIFVSAMAPKEINASAQSLIFVATTGIGLFLGTQLAGMVMDRNSADGKFAWSRIWAVPLAITLAGAIVLGVVFEVPRPAEFQSPPPKGESMPVMAAQVR